MTKTKCSKCGSEFELTKHHDRDNHMSRKNPAKHTIILCRTCHSLLEHTKDIKLYHRGKEKRDNKRTDKYLK